MSALECTSGLRIGRVPGYPRYRVLSDGTVWYRPCRSPESGWRRRKFVVDRSGYFCLNLSAEGRRRRFYVHRAVLLAFVGPPSEGQECRHLDGDKRNNRLENLCWGTSKENVADQVLHGTLVRGSGQSQAKVTEADVLEIRRRAAAGRYGIQRQLAREFGISDTVVSLIVSRKKWQHVPDC